MLCVAHSICRAAPLLLSWHAMLKVRRASNRRTRRGTSPTLETNTSPSLAVSGFFMLLALFVFANPLFGVVESWPWEHFVQDEYPRATAVAALWTMTGVWALVMAFTGAVRVRALVLLALVVPLIFVLCERTGPESGATSIGIDRYGFGEMVLMTLMGGGLAYALQLSSRTTGCWIAAGAALCFLLHLLISPQSSHADTKLMSYFHDVQSSWEQGLFRDVPVKGNQTQFDFTMMQIIPMAMILLTCLVAITAWIGARWRKWLWCGIVLLLLSAVVPYLYVLFTGDDAGRMPQGGARFSSQLHSLLVQDGLAPLLLGIFALGDVARARKASHV